MQPIVRRVISFFLVCSLVCASGCVSFRKKFVRKGKTEQSPELFLDLKDYGSAPTEDLFHTHFIYAKGWLEELAELVMFNGNKKRIRKSIDAALESFGQIDSYLTDEGKYRIRSVYNEMQSIRVTVYNPFKLNPGNSVNIVSDIKKTIADFKYLCSYDALSPYFIDTKPVKRR